MEKEDQSGEESCVLFPMFFTIRTLHLSTQLINSKYRIKKGEARTPFSERCIICTFTPALETEVVFTLCFIMQISFSQE